MYITMWLENSLFDAPRQSLAYPIELAKGIPQSGVKSLRKILSSPYFMSF